MPSERQEELVSRLAGAVLRAADTGGGWERAASSLRELFDRYNPALRPEVAKAVQSPLYVGRATWMSLLTRLIEANPAAEDAMRALASDIEHQVPRGDSRFYHRGGSDSWVPGEPEAAPPPGPDFGDDDDDDDESQEQA